MATTAKLTREREARFQHATRDRPTTGIFGPQWYKWRGSIVRCELEGEKAFSARLLDMRDGVARLAIIDPQLPKPHYGAHHVRGALATGGQGHGRAH